MQNISVEKAVLKSLDYDCRPVPYEAIHPAHESTFQWIYSSPSQSSPKPHHFLEWLQKGNGLFWIRGKPGAGKSTLMKYITANPRTKVALQTWANPDRAITGTHYFWSSGSPMQKSYGGLLRSVLFDILSQVPALIAFVCQGESWWQDLVKSASAPSRILPEWSELSLLSCLHRLSTMEGLPVEAKFCIFIDGLDEYAGHVNGEAKDFTDMCKMLLELAASTRLKICVASRPSNVFNDHFGGDLLRVLDVQELTTHDIARYARDGLKSLDWVQLAHAPVEDTPSELMESFVDQIQKQSKGVFLWVFLVVRLLRNGFANGDSLSELQKRLNSLPSDLEPFFRRILEDVDSCYHQKMAGFLRIALVSKNGSLPFVVYTAHEYEYDNPRPLLDDLICEDINDGDPIRLKARMNKRLHAITRGLLEFQGDNVQFLHRTVTDFLRTGPMMQFLMEKSHKDFTPNIAILRAVLGIWKAPSDKGLLSVLLSSQTDESILNGLFRSLAYYSASYGLAAELEDRAITVNILDQWSSAVPGVVSSYAPQIWQDSRVPDKVLSAMPGFECPSWLSWTERMFIEVQGDTLTISSILFRVSLLEAGFVSYLVSKLEEDADYLRGLPCSPLTILADSLTDYRLLGICAEQLTPLWQLLLELGYDPNERETTTDYHSFSNRIPIHTPWTTLLQQVKPLLADDGGCHIVGLLQHGADLGAITLYNSGKFANPLLPAWVVICLSPFDLKYFRFDTGKYLEIIRRILSTGVDLCLLMTAHDPEEPDTGWEVLKGALRSLPLIVQKQDGGISRTTLELTSRILYELAKAEEAGGHKILPWAEIKPQLRTIYPAGLIEPLFTIIGSDDSS